MAGGLRSAFAAEDPEKRAKQQKQMLYPSVVSLAWCIAMVIVGAQVSRVEIPTYLPDCCNLNVKHIF